MGKKILFFVTVACFFSYCVKSKNDIVNSDTAAVWITNPGKTALLWQTSTPFITDINENLPTIVIDNAQQFQKVDGFGYTFTGGSASLINSLEKSKKDALLKELFGSDDNSLGISYLRVSMGASDLSESVFTYNDLPNGETDLDLQKFSLSKDFDHLIPVLKEILAINPKIKILGSPWTAPLWMKTNNNSVGGNLQTKYYGVYAQYFVKYIQAMQAQGIPIDAVTVQNEPQHGGNNPSMVMSSAQQADFVKNHLGPAFKNANLTTKIIVWDHNCDNPDYPLAILNDTAAKTFVDGSAFHLYAGDVSSLSIVHNAHPDKNVYFTEQWTGANGDFGGDLKWHTKNVIIGTMRNWSKNALEWNLANDANFQPHTPGGCSQCKGALTIDNGNISRNVSYYIIGQASKFVPQGSIVLGTNELVSLPNVAFKTPDQKTVLIVLNEEGNAKKFNIVNGDKKMSYSLSAGSVGTFVW
jgi:glucosylceramidase